MPSALVPDMSPMKSSFTGEGSVGGGFGAGGRRVRIAGEPRIADAGKLGQEPLGGLIEVGQVLCGDGFHVRQLHRTRVSRHAVHAHFEMQVWTGSEASHADEPDDLLLGNVLAHVHANLEMREVAVECAVAAAVVDGDALAVAALDAHEGHAT